MARNNYRKRTRKISNKGSVSLHPALENLKERLSSPRLRAAGTIYTYLETGGNFLAGLGEDREPTDSDFRRYFIRRREQGISERTLRKEFFHLKKLALANNWVWPFTADDTPYPEDEEYAPALLPEQVEQLIKARAKLSKAERFFLAVATTWVVRREELSRIKKRDYNEDTITIHTAKHGRRVKHLIPDCLHQVFADYRPKEHTPGALTIMYGRICLKTGLKHEKGYGFHSIRRTLNTMLAALLPKNSLDPALLADYAGWSKKSLGPLYGGAAMVGVYRHPEILDTDPYGGDRVIYSIHPFLPLWGPKPHGKKRQLAVTAMPPSKLAHA